MAAAVTYNGVPGGEGGTIFQGIKFWVAQRVPMRAELLNHIKSNSGTVVPLEKDATYMIADHARKDAPTGSYSWKFITESVDNGVVQLPDRYRNAWTPDIKRPAGSARPTKGTRTAFTDDDDAFLAQFVLSHQVDRTGNKIFQQFETINNRHTWQSWRNRYIKKLMLLPLEQLEAFAARAANLEPPVQSTPAQATPTPVAARRSATSQQSSPSKAAKETKMRKSPQKKPAPVVQNPRDDDEEEDEAEEEDVRVEDDAVARDNADRDIFYKDLADYASSCGRQIAPNYLLCGHEFGLWELAKAVAAQRVPTEEVDWIKVAEDLAFEWEIAEKASDALKYSYADNLVEFLEIITSFQRAEEDDEGDIVPEPSSSGASVTSPIRIPSSPPERFLPVKRRLNDAEAATSAKKRRRLDKDRVIQPTPEKEIASSKRKRSRARSRSNSRPLSRSSLGSQLPVAEEDNDDGEVRFSFETEVPLPQLGRQGTTADVSPSQQLRSEWLESSPASKQSKKKKMAKQDAKSKPKSRSTSVSEARESSEQPAASTSSKSGKPRKQKAPNAKSKEDQVAEAIQLYESLGYPNRIVLEGLQRTSMVPGIATVVMQSLKDGKGVPTNHEGIWTDRDDEGLKLLGTVDVDKEGETKEERKLIRKAIKTAARLQEKHGSDKVELRRQFLAAQKNGA